MHFSLLGPLEIKHHETVIEIGGGKLQTVLGALILARGKVVSTDRLVSLIWAEDPPSKPYVTVRSYISHLRRVLEPERGAGERGTLLVTRSPGYALEVDPHNIDAFRFEQLATDASQLMHSSRFDEAQTKLTEALDLWNSDDLSDSPLALFVGEAHRLVELRHHASALRFDALLKTGQHHEVIPDLRSLVEQDPTREQYRAQLMLALYRSGRQGEAIEVFQSGVRAAIDTSGLDISPALADLERQILNNDPALDWQPSDQVIPVPTPDNAPVAVEQPIGRKREATTVDDLLSARFGPEQSGSDIDLTSVTDNFIAVTGEPGIGKTNLLDYTATRARAVGAVVVWGFGHNGSQHIPLVPWRVALTDLVESVDDAALTDMLGRRGSELAQLVPLIGERLGIEPTEASDASVLREAVARFIGQYASERPLLICLDDLHWVDDQSARMLSYVIPQLRDKPVIFIGSWRSTEIVEPELATPLAELGRLAAGYRIELEGLSVGAVGELLVSQAQAQAEPQATPISEPTTRELHQRTAGNPLFITELVRSGPSKPGELRPTGTVNDVIATRLASLPAECSELLTIASLCIGSFDERLLAELSGLGEDELLDALELLLAARLIVEDPQDATQFALSHSLVGESLAMQMSGLRKARLHNRIAKALERHQAPIGELAYHYLQGAPAGDREIAAATALAAARHTSKLHDHQSSIERVGQALGVLDDAEDNLALRAELMIELGHDLKFLDRIPESHAASTEAFSLAEQAGSVELMVNAALVYCGQSGDEASAGLRWLGYWNPAKPALEMLRKCIDKLGEGRDRTTVLMAYSSQLFGEFYDPAEALKSSNQAVAEARQSGNRELLPAAIYHRFSNLQRLLSYEDRRDSLEECLQLALSMNLLYREVSVRRSLMVLRLDEGNIDGARVEVEAGVQLAKQIDDPGVAMISDSMSIALDLYQGELARAEQGINAAFVTYGEMGSATMDAIGIQFAVLQRELGNLAQVADMMRWKLDGYPGPPYAMSLAMVLAEQGDHDGARALIVEYENDQIESGSEGVLQFMTLAFYAETLVALQDAGRASVLYDALAPADGRTVSMFNGIAIYGSGSYYLGKLATLLGRFDDAHAHFAIAQEHHRAVGAKPYQLRTLLAEAVLARAENRANDASKFEAEAKTLADSIGMSWILTAP